MRYHCWYRVMRDNKLWNGQAGQCNRAFACHSLSRMLEQLEFMPWVQVMKRYCPQMLLSEIYSCMKCQDSIGFFASRSVYPCNASLSLLTASFCIVGRTWL